MYLPMLRAAAPAHTASRQSHLHLERSDRNKLDIAMRHARLNIGRKRITGQQRGYAQPLLPVPLMDRNFPIVQDVNFALIDIETEYIVSQFSETAPVTKPT
jgi:hypothetical protein